MMTKLAHILAAVALGLFAPLASAQMLVISSGGGASSPPPPPPPPAAMCEDTHNAASVATIGTAVAGADADDCVVVPAGSGNPGDVTVTGITLIGPGKDAGSPATLTGGSITINAHATSTTRVSGLIFDGADVEADWNRGEAQWFLDDSYFDIDAGGTLVLANGGVFYGNEVVSDAGTGGDVFQVLGPIAHDEWTRASTFGTDDTGGLVNLYIEDNIFDRVRETAPDGDNGARLVIRHNVYNDSSIVFHSTNPNDTGDFGGTRHFEIYENDFNRVTADQPINKWVWVRGATGVIADNTMDEAPSSEYPGKPEIKFTVGCPSSYPTQYQVGQDDDTDDATPDHPVAIYNNGLTPTISIEGGPVVTCGTPGDYIQSGRDYVTSQTWTYTKFTYPHPNRPDQ